MFSIENGHVVWTSGPHNFDLLNGLAIFPNTPSKTKTKRGLLKIRYIAILNCQRVNANNMYVYRRYSTKFEKIYTMYVSLKWQA